MSDRAGVLYVVATPIGNLQDISARALEILGRVALVAAEDTRHSRKLLDRFGIRKPLLSYHDHNERQRYGEILERLRAGETVALISDAGTPCIADPGYRLIAACRTAGVPVVPVPGASALVAALSVSGVATDRFAFEGYLPSRTKARTDLFKRLAGEQRTLVFYETPRRLLAALNDLVQVFTGRPGPFLSRLAFVSDRTDASELWMMDWDGSNATQLTKHRSIALAPAWSPDGRHLVFTSDRGGAPQIYRTPAAGGGAERLTLEHPYNARASYSPDGKSLTLVTRVGDDYRVGLLDLASKRLQVLSNGRLDESPSFAPNGGMIIYASKTGSRALLEAVSVDGRVRQRLALDAGDVREPAWAPYSR